MPVSLTGRILRARDNRSYSSAGADSTAVNASDNPRPFGRNGCPHTGSVGHRTRAEFTRQHGRLSVTCGSGAFVAPYRRVTRSEKIWRNGELIDWEQAQIHVLSHVIHYGSACFEGIRSYMTPSGSVVFRLDAHLRRLINSSKIYSLDLAYDEEALSDAVLATIRANHLEACYIRPIVLRGYGHLGINPDGIPIDTYIAVWKWGSYLGQEALEAGVDVCVSTWSRFAPNTAPATAKASGHYLNSQLIKIEAARNGYAEGIALDTNGFVSEGSGENIFLVRDGVLYTPEVAQSVLAGITRDSVLAISIELGLEVREQAIPREWLYISDELFFTGTAAEITPIRSVDRIDVGRGQRGAVTQRIQSRFFDIVSGSAPAPAGWLTPVG